MQLKTHQPNTSRQYASYKRFLAIRLVKPFRANRLHTFLPKEQNGLSGQSFYNFYNKFAYTRNGRQALSRV